MFLPMKSGAILSCHLAALSRRYRSVEILPQLRIAVNNSFWKNFFLGKKSVFSTENTYFKNKIIFLFRVRPAGPGAYFFNYRAGAPFRGLERAAKSRAPRIAEGAP